ncbi:MAG: hypothetical protein ACI84C_001392 [Flavobacteriales bacterium]|jgi:hypothetical protein
MLSRLQRILILMALLFAVASVQGCMSQKNEFEKKKYKIRKGAPPAQRYFNKYAIFKKRTGSNYRGGKSTTDIR